MSYIGSKPANKAVVASDLDPTVITGQTALAVAPADTDEFIISDAGVLKRLDASLVGGGGITVAQQFRLLADKAGGNSNGTVLTNWEESDTDYQAIGSAWSQSSGIFSTTSTGIYLCNWTLVTAGNTSGDAFDPNVQISTDSGSNYTTRSRVWGHVIPTVSHDTVATSFIFDVNNTSTFRLRFRESQDNDISTATTIKGGTAENYTQINFLRLGDT